MVPWRAEPGLVSVPTAASTADTDSKTGKRVEAKKKHYTPRGPRANWSREQYTVYKEEKQLYWERQEKKREEAAEEAAEQAVDGAIKWKYIKVGKLNRSVLAVIPGRRDGEEALPKDFAGLPIVEDRKEEEDRVSSFEPRVSHEARKLWEATQRPRWLWAHRTRSGEKWEVPETDSENELEPEVLVEYDLYGEKKARDYWPSKWRKLVAEQVNDTWINQTVSPTDMSISLV
jgi:hypothetical protein